MRMERSTKHTRGSETLGNSIPANSLSFSLLSVLRLEANSQIFFELLLLHSTPWLVEAGILLDVTVGVFIIGIIVDRIQRAFDSLDTRKLTTLRE